MTLDQLTSVRRWLLTHHRAHSLECRLWNALLTGWVMGTMGTAVAVVLGTRWGLLTSLALHLAPGGYVRLRARLHRHGRLRCDWLGCVAL